MLGVGTSRLCCVYYVTNVYTGLSRRTATQLSHIHITGVSYDGLEENSQYILNWLSLCAQIHYANWYKYINFKSFFQGANSM